MDFIRSKYSGQLDSFTLDMLTGMVGSNYNELSTYYSTVMFPGKSVEFINSYIAQDLAEQLETAILDILRTKRNDEKARRERLRDLYAQKMEENQQIKDLTGGMTRVDIQDQMTDDF